MLFCLVLIMECVLCFFSFFITSFFCIKGFCDVRAVAPVTLIKPQKSAFKALSAELSAIPGDRLDRFPFLSTGCQVRLRRGCGVKTNLQIFPPPPFFFFGDTRQFWGGGDFVRVMCAGTLIYALIFERRLSYDSCCDLCDVAGD